MRFAGGAGPFSVMFSFADEALRFVTAIEQAGADGVEIVALDGSTLTKEDLALMAEPDDAG